MLLIFYRCEKALLLSVNLVPALLYTGSNFASIFSTAYTLYASYSVFFFLPPTPTPPLLPAVDSFVPISGVYVVKCALMCTFCYPV